MSISCSYALSVIAVMSMTGCAHVMVKPFADTIPPLPKPNTKVALVGFSTYSALLMESRRGYNYTINEYVATVSAKDDLKAVCDLGRPLESFTKNGTKPVTPEVAQAFMQRSRSIVPAQGFEQEIDKILINSRPSAGNSLNDGHYEMSNWDVDYYVVAGFSPPFFRSDTNLLLQLLNIFATAFSLFTVPEYGASSSSAVFDVYDSNLRLLRTFSYEGRYQYIAAWWILPGQKNENNLSLALNEGRPRMTPGCVWEPDIKRFERDFSNWLSDGQHGKTGNDANERLSQPKP